MPAAMYERYYIQTCSNKYMLLMLLHLQSNRGLEVLHLLLASWVLTASLLVTLGSLNLRLSHMPSTGDQAVCTGAEWELDPRCGLSSGLLWPSRQQTHFA